MNEFLFESETKDIIGAAIEVHKTLGSGFLESVYHEALSHEFKIREIPFYNERKLIVRYKNHLLNGYYIADFVCYETIIVELKALNQLTSDHTAQVINYLKATGFKVGLLLNFGRSKLDIKRLIY